MSEQTAATRTEHDSMGDVEVPADALWGAQTARAVENFPISGQPVPAPSTSTSGTVVLPSRTSALPLTLGSQCLLLGCRTRFGGEPRIALGSHMCVCLLLRCDDGRGTRLRAR